MLKEAPEESFMEIRWEYRTLRKGLLNNERCALFSVCVCDPKGILVGGFLW